LENLGKASQVSLSISGISGTINTLPKAKTLSELYITPYYMSVSGSYINVMNFVESLYNLSFVTTINSLSLSSNGKDTVGVTLSANLYIRK